MFSECYDHYYGTDNTLSVVGTYLSWLQLVLLEYVTYPIPSILYWGHGVFLETTKFTPTSCLCYQNRLYGLPIEFNSENDVTTNLTINLKLNTCMDIYNNFIHEYAN
jgi:hypothetical protein